MEKLKTRFRMVPASSYGASDSVRPQVELVLGGKTVATIIPEEIDELSNGAIELREKIQGTVELYNELVSLARKTNTPGLRKSIFFSKLVLHRSVGWFILAPLLVIGGMSATIEVGDISRDWHILSLVSGFFTSLVTFAIYSDFGAREAYGQRERESQKSFAAPFFAKTRIEWVRSVPSLSVAVVDARGNMVKDFRSYPTFENSLQEAMEQVDKAREFIDRTSDSFAFASGLVQRRLR